MNTNGAFLLKVSDKVRTDILKNVAENYGITQLQAFVEVTDPAAEHLLDYLTGPTRIATSALMQMNGFKK